VGQGSDGVYVHDIVYAYVRHDGGMQGW